MMESTNEEANCKNAVPMSISIKIKTPKRGNQYPREKEKDDIVTPSSRVQETLDEDERMVIYKNKFSLDRKSNDRSAFHEVACTSSSLSMAKSRDNRKRLDFDLNEFPPKDERKVYKNKISVDGEFNDPGVFNYDVGCNSTSINADLAKFKKPPKSKIKLKKRQQQQRRSDYDHEGRIGGEAEYDADVIKAAETLMMMRYGRSSCPSMAETRGNRKCLGLDLNKPSSSKEAI